MKKVDSRVRTLIENGVQTGQRSFFVMVGDHGKDQVMYLHYMLTKARVATKPSMLWCYKKELGFSSHRMKRMKQHQAALKKGLKNPDTEDPFELFISSTNIRYCYYKESHKILGNTYGMLVLQDFEALTPNLLARTIETVEGGGIVVLLLRTMTSLKQLYTMTMDVHSRYRTASHDDVVGRFNERFILSLGDFKNCLVVDDELNILPLSAAKDVKPLQKSIDDEEKMTPEEKELKELKESLEGTEPVYSLVKQAKTLDQAKAILTFIEAISEKTLRSTVAMTAARGRGKSAAMGIAIASAVAYGYSNIFVTSPSPENLKTLFEFVLKTFDLLGYEEHTDYDVLQSTNPDFNKAVVRINVYKNHRQTIQYIQPCDAHVLGQAELVVIDEAAAIPLPHVKALMGPYLVFMASTINGYEGTGRSLSLKLIHKLREESKGSAEGGRKLREIKLEYPIRYALNDPTEKWLNSLLCLDVCSVPRSSLSGFPSPSDCNLFILNRDTLFSYHPVAESFLQKMMSLYVASHYKNSPNDLQMLSDAPAHELFVLLPPTDKDQVTLPEPLVVIQVCYEGQILRQTLLNSLSRGKRADGDLIPWTLSQQFQDDDFATLSGARIVRVATNPDYMGMGYGTQAIKELIKYYEGKIANISEVEKELNSKGDDENDLVPGDDDLKTEEIKIRDSSKLQPLLLALEEKKPPSLQWVGVSYGVTLELIKFWKKNKFVPVYLRQTANELTGEHTCIMIRTLNSGGISVDKSWLYAFWKDFRKRFINLLGFEFRSFVPSLALSIIESENDKLKKSTSDKDGFIRTPSDVKQRFSSYDLKRLESYTNNMLDYHVIVDMLPAIAHDYFLDRMRSAENPQQNVSLSAVQRAILLGMGLQCKTVEMIEKDLQLPVSQTLALFIRALKKVNDFYKGVIEQSYEKELEEKKEKETGADGNNNEEKRNVFDADEWHATEQDLDEELDEAAKEKMKQLKEKQRELIDAMDLSNFAVAADENEWKNALNGKKKQNLGSGPLLSVKNKESSKTKRKHKTLEDVAKEHEKAEAKKLKGKKSKTI
ncbi:hypothetical protein MP638_002483 [Amoeboaphelidium occidentale]|nr:hypothetical protein MP638_002483 [Amoeboaphelidium occidentale]